MFPNLRRLWCMLRSLGSLSKLLWEHSLPVLPEHTEHKGWWWQSSVGPHTLGVPEHTEHTQLERSRWVELPELPEHTEHNQLELPERTEASHTERTEAEHTEERTEAENTEAEHTQVYIEAPWSTLGWASRWLQVAAEPPAWPLQLGQALPLA